VTEGIRTTSCPKCRSRRIQIVGEALNTTTTTTTTTTGLQASAGMTWKCLDCDYRWTDDHGRVAGTR
jgi:predicted nucleic-acid-binding Zn-ribbon protein